MGYATGQFGKNHLGDKNEFLPTVHGFDEFIGYLYPPRRDGRPVPSGLSAGTRKHGRSAQHGPLGCDRRG
jgi:arylsulfatase A-like enzyme